MNRDRRYVDVGLADKIGYEETGTVDNSLGLGGDIIGLRTFIVVKRSPQKDDSVSFGNHKNGYEQENAKRSPQKDDSVSFGNHKNGYEHENEKRNPQKDDSVSFGNHKNGYENEVVAA